MTEKFVNLIKITNLTLRSSMTSKEDKTSKFRCITHTHTHKCIERARQREHLENNKSEMTSLQKQWQLDVN